MSPHYEKIHSGRHFAQWFLLSCLAGFVNAGGFMACHRFVTHMTGFATLFGTDLAQSAWADAFSMLSMPLFFIAGAMTSAWLTDRRIHKGLSPRYGLAMSLVLACLLTATFGGYQGWFGGFGDELLVNRDYLFLALLCGGSGLQNAIVTSYSGSMVRTTHLTGMTTDLGIGIVRVLFPTPDEGRMARERRLNKLRLGSIASFVLGSASGAFVFTRLGYLGFLFPAGMALFSIFSLPAVFRTKGKDE